MRACAARVYIWRVHARTSRSSVRVLAAGRLKIVSPPRASPSLQHVGTMARCQDTSPFSVLTRRHEEQRLIIYKRTPVRRVWLGTSPALNVPVYEAIRFIAYSI